MPTDEERREVARRLRKNTGKGMQLILNVAFSAFEFTGCSERTLNADEAALKLADLIEPPLQCPHYHSDRHYCSIHEDIQPIDREALLALADEIDRKSNDGTVNPDPMKPIASSLDLFGYARRIREAVGA